MRCNSKKQMGFLMPLAMFVVFGLAALALVVGRMTSTSFGGAVQHGLSTQSYLTARSGAEIALHRLLFKRGEQVEVENSCALIDGERFEFKGQSPGRCVAEVACSFSADSSSGLHLQLSSTGRCGAEQLNAVRSVIYQVHVGHRGSIGERGESIESNDVTVANRVEQVNDIKIFFKKEHLP